MALAVLRLLHWGPILALSVIGTITTSSVLCALQWWPVYTQAGALNMTVFLMWNVLTLYNFFTAAFTGPGHVPYGWKPKDPDHVKFVQYCNQCEGYKAPRSHHCRKCQRCVMKMDHHCPWINNCVGHFNHGSFTLFLFFAPIGCIHGLCILIPAMYRAINRTYYIYYGTGKEPLVHLGIKSFIGCMFAVGLAIGVIIAVGALLFIQLKSILKNETGIESWIIDKAYYRDIDEGEPEFIYPYHLGCWRNFRMVFHFRRRPELNGIYYPVIEGCDQYTITVEQIKQKKEKQQRSVEYMIQENYSGSFFPITMGPRICCCPPCTDEPRIAVSTGNRVVVTRWKKRWLYGDKVLTDNELKRTRRVRGWFPRRCAIEVMNGTQEEEVLEEPNHTAEQDPKLLKRSISKKTD